MKIFYRAPAPPRMHNPYCWCFAFYKLELKAAQHTIMSTYQQSVYVSLVSQNKQKENVQHHTFILSYPFSSVTAGASMSNGWCSYQTVSVFESEKHYLLGMQVQYHLLLGVYKHLIYVTIEVATMVHNFPSQFHLPSIYIYVYTSGPYL